ncbi:MAG: dihydrolipoyl dehydrogenase [Dehalococcoidia bacterium]|nr:MAG: dihydrolipoyl dehydrogenase [Dehalococcoidia bacterium]
MKNYDVIVIGSGAGAIISDEAAAQGLTTALIDKGPLIGGTCINWGCIPSKMLIYTADRIVEIEEARKLGIEAEIKNIDFHSIMKRMRNSRQESQVHIIEGIKQSKNLDFYEGEGYFVDDYLLEVNGKRFKGKRIFIASGSRPFIPPIKGLENVDYLTNESVLELKDRPDSLIIIGGGYIAVEYGHFFAAMGTKVTILEMADRLVLSEEVEISNLLKGELSKRMGVHTNTLAEEVKGSENGIVVITKDTKTGKRREFAAQRIMMAVGRRSNADKLKVENTGVETDKKGFIKVNEYLETNRQDIFAIGDANGQQMFRHMANREAEIVVQNAFYGTNIKVDYSAVPHAVYSHPQVASVGMTEAQAREGHDVLLGRMKYLDIAKGKAMIEKEGFAKVIVEKGSNQILGFHIIGPYAPELIQEVVNAMTSGGGMEELGQGIHIHPSLSELIQYTLSNIGES